MKKKKIKKESKVNKLKLTSKVISRRILKKTKRPTVYIGGHHPEPYRNRFFVEEWKNEEENDNLFFR